MKNLFFLATLFLLCVTTGCEKDDGIDEILEVDSENTIANFVTPNTQIAIGEIVIKYEIGTSEIDKQIIRDQYQVVNYKKCECADPTLELWIFDVDSNGTTPGGVSIETVVNGTRGTHGVEESQINDIIKHQGFKLNNPFGPQDLNYATSLLSPSNSGVTIAVLDTGIDYNYFGFDSPFLYNSQLNTNTCMDNGMIDYFGWDFVNNDNQPFEDHGHGTQATFTMYQILTAANIDFQILPIKVFNEHGDASYFDILCGFKYVTNNSDVDIINMSFGWYGADYELLRKFIEETQDNVVIVTSAGNDKNNNDNIPHYPSSYEMDNILSVASWNGNTYNVGLSKFSNIGLQSVDIAAMGERIPFYIDENEYIMLSGTSYSAAVTSGIAGKLYLPNSTPTQHISTILATAIEHYNLMDIKYSSYLYY